MAFSIFNKASFSSFHSGTPDPWQPESLLLQLFMEGTSYAPGGEVWKVLLIPLEVSSVFCTNIVKKEHFKLKKEIELWNVKRWKCRKISSEKY